MPVLKFNEIIAATNLEKSELISNILEALFKPNEINADPMRDQRLYRTINIFKNLPLPNNTFFTNPVEVKNVIKARNSKKVPGHDEIRNSVLKRLPLKQIVQ